MFRSYQPRQYVDVSFLVRYILQEVYKKSIFPVIIMKKTSKATRLPNAAGYSEFCISVDGKTFGILFLSLAEATTAALDLQAQGRKCEIFCRESGKVVTRFD